MIKKSTVISTILGITLTLSLGASIYTASGADGKQYKINSNGMSYGTHSKVLNVVNKVDEPDLIAAMGIDGTLGYVKSKDLEEKEPKNVQEANLLNKEKQDLKEKRKKEGKKFIKEIPLYDVDGKTVIGTFGIGNVNDTYIESDVQIQNQNSSDN